MCQKVKVVKSTVFFTCDQIFGALIHLNLIILIINLINLIILNLINLINLFLIYNPWCKYVIYGCSSARTTPEVSLHRSLKLEENIVAVIT